MQPDLNIMSGRQYSDTSIAFDPPPATGLFPMLRGCRQEHVSLRIIQRYKVMLIFERERLASRAQWMLEARSHRDRALGGMMGEYATQQVPQLKCLLIVRGARMDGEQPIPLAHIIAKSCLNGVCHPASLICRRDVIG